MSSTPMVAALVASPYPHRGFVARRAGHGTQPAYCRRIPVAAGWRGVRRGVAVALLRSQLSPQPAYSACRTANLVAFRGLWLFFTRQYSLRGGGTILWQHTEGAFLPPQLHGQHHRNEVADAAIPDLD